MKALRLTLKLSPIQFAQVIGIGREQAHNRERGRTPWHPEEIAAAKAKIVAHQNAVSLALDALES